MISQSVADAKKELAINFNEGMDCPCCGQLVKQYRRSISNQMAKSLIKLYHLPIGFHHRRDFDEGFTCGDFAKLKYWNLIHPKENEDSEKKDSGVWRTTSAGMAFVRNTLKVSKYALIYNGDLRGYEGKLIDIEQALGLKFNYEELMGWK